MWTAYYLKRARPELEIVVLERAYAGFGASGRNGGWLYPGLATDPVRYGGPPEAAAAMRAAMHQTVDEVLRVAAAEGIDADVVRGGALDVARTPAQALRARQQAEAEEQRWLGADELASRIRIAGALGAAFTPDAARVQPAKLIRGLAAAVERLGVTIHEQTTVREIEPFVARTDRGTVRARHVLRCLEGFTASIRGQRRTWLPMNSSMIVTEPLPADVWAQIGWAGGELLGDAAHGYLYAQRTADGRIALGGRGVPYRFASRTDRDGVTQPRTVTALTTLLHELFPAAAAVPIARSWCGVLGVPRDWCPTVAYDGVSGLGHAGGYVGSGLSTANLAGRTLADLVLGADTELTRLPWTNHAVRRWEPEPLRWLGVHAMYALYRAADRRETASGRPRTSALARLADTITGR